MKIGTKFNTLAKEEYFLFIDNHKRYADFNTLGLYRSLIENDKLSLGDKIEVRDYAHKVFGKFFNFLQLKDPDTFFKVSTIGQVLTDGAKQKIWRDVQFNQKKILEDKRVRHRNFGSYSKHLCGYEWCPYNGMMIRQGSELAEASMHFSSDKKKLTRKDKSKRLKAENRMIKQKLGWGVDEDYKAV